MGPVGGALSRRAVWLIAILVGVVVMVQTLVVLAPGGAADAIATDPGQRAELAVAWGEDRPAVVQIAAGSARVLTGDLGESRVVAPGMPVRAMAVTAWVQSVPRLLAALALGLALAMGAAWSGKARGPLSNTLSATPVFLLGIGVVLGLNEAAWVLIQADVIARPTWFALPDQGSWLREFVAIVVLAVASGALGELRRDCSVALTSARSSQWAAAVVARGEPLGRHLLTNLIAPVCRSLAARVVLLAGGLVVIEKIMMLQGAGALLWRAAVGRDGLLAAGVAVVGALLLASLRLALDGAALWADPRLRSQP